VLEPVDHQLGRCGCGGLRGIPGHAGLRGLEPEEVGGFGHPKSVRLGQAPEQWQQPFPGHRLPHPQRHLPLGQLAVDHVDIAGFGQGGDHEAQVGVLEVEQHALVGDLHLRRERARENDESKQHNNPPERPSDRPTA
jgi:hypothetical protein